MHRSFFLLTSILCLLSSASALTGQGRQDKNVSIYGVVRHQLHDREYEHYLLIGYATVTIAYNNDTIKVPTNFRGEFIAKQIPANTTVSITITHLSYQTYNQNVDVKNKDLLLNIDMEEKVNKLGEVVVNADIPLFTMSGDTVVYNARAVKTMEGDELIEILRQMPGVVVDETTGNIEIHGEKLSRAYVNGKLLFGDEGRDVLYNLLAKEVTRIKVFDEISQRDRKLGKMLRHDAGRVMNIETKNPIISVGTGHFILSGGTDLSENEENKLQKRYGAGATTNFFSEKTIIKFEGFVNNVSRRSNRLDEIFRTDIENPNYARDKQMVLSGNRYWGDRNDMTGISFEYVFNDNYNRNFSSVVRDYFPTVDYNNKMYADSSNTILHIKEHKLDVSAIFLLNKMGMMRVNTSLSYSENIDNSNRNTLDVVNDISSNREITEHSRDNAKGLKQEIDWMPVYREGARFIPIFTLKADMTNHDGSEFRVDTLSIDMGQKLLVSNPVGQHRDYGAAVTLNISPEQKNDDVGWEMSGSYEIGYTKSKSIKYAFDRFVSSQNPTVDTANTYDYTYNYMNHSARVDFGYSKKSVSLITRLGVSRSTLNKDESFPDNYDYGRTFDHINGFFRFSIKKGFYSFADMEYEIKANLPSIEQLRFQIDDRDPLTLRAGNPSLKEEYLHNIRFVLNPYRSEKGSILTLTALAKIWSNNITTRSRFFSEDTPLEGYDFTARANSTLYSYDNIDGIMNLNTSLTYSVPLRKLKSTLNLSGRYDFEKSASYIEDAINRVKGNRIFFGAGLFGTLSQVLRTGINTNISRNRYVSGFGLKNDYYVYGVSANINYAPSVFVVNINHQSVWERYVTNSANNNKRHILNALTGVYFYKRNCAITISVFDIFNRSTRFSSTLGSEYLENRFTPSSGRYWTINLSYKFNSNR